MPQQSTRSTTLLVAGVFVLAMGLNGCQVVQGIVDPGAKERELLAAKKFACKQMVDQVNKLFGIGMSLRSKTPAKMRKSFLQSDIDRLGSIREEIQAVTVTDAALKKHQAAYLKDLKQMQDGFASLQGAKNRAAAKGGLDLIVKADKQIKATNKLFVANCPNVQKGFGVK